MTLEQIRKDLEAERSLSVSQRGAGKGIFLFVRSATRAIEIYIESAGYVIEYWDNADEESDDQSVNRDETNSEADALARIKKWLNTR